MILSHSILCDVEFSDAHSLLVSHVAAGFTFEPQCLLLRGLGEFLLKRVLLSAVSMFLSLVLAFTQSQGAAFSRFVDGNCVSLLSLTFWAVSGDFLRCFHIQSNSIESVYNNKPKHIKLVVLR